jgi:hypothetical protein
MPEQCEARSKSNGHPRKHFALGSNQDSPDPEGPPNPLIFQQLAVLTAGSCTLLLGFDGFDARVC